MQLSVREIAEYLGARVIGNSDLVIHGISSIDNPKPGSILYAERTGMLESLKDIKDIAVITRDIPDDHICSLVIHPNPRIAFSKVSEKFHTHYWQEYGGISEYAFIEPDVQIAFDAVICQGAFVGSETRIGSRTRILPNAYIGRGVVIGDDCVICPGAAILEGTTIGDRVIINSNAVIGSEGFGFSESDGILVKMPQVGGVIIGNDVEIGACTCVDRGTIDNTVIGEGSKLDNLVQVGHNVVIGKNVRIAAQTGFPGRVKVEDDAVIGGQAGFQNGITVGKSARVASQAGVFKSIPPNQTVSGYPALPHGEALRILSLFKRLPEFFDRIKELESKMSKINEIKGSSGAFENKR